MVRVALVTAAAAVPAVCGNLLDTITQSTDQVRQAGKTLHGCLAAAQSDAEKKACRETASTALGDLGVPADQLQSTLETAAQDATRAVAGLSGKAEEEQCIKDAARDKAKIEACKAARMQAVRSDLVAAAGVAADAIKDSDVIRALTQSAAEEAAALMKSCSEDADACKEDALAKFAEVLGKDPAPELKMEFERALKEAANRMVAEAVAACKKQGDTKESCDGIVGELLEQFGLTRGADASGENIMRAMEAAAEQHARDAQKACMGKEAATPQGCRTEVANAMVEVLGSDAAARAGKVIDENARAAAADTIVDCRKAKETGGDAATCGDLVTAYYEAAGKERPAAGSKEEKRAEAKVKRDAAVGIAEDLLEVALAAAPAEMTERLRDAKENLKANIDTLFADEDTAKRAKRAAEALAEATKDFVGKTIRGAMAAGAFDETTKAAKEAKEAKRKELKADVSTMLQDTGLSETETADSFIKKYFADEIASISAACADADDAAAQKACRESAMEEALQLGLMARELFGARDSAAIREAVRITVACKEGGDEDAVCEREWLEPFKAMVGVSEVDADTQSKIAELAREMLAGNPTVVRIRKALKVAAKVAEACSDETKVQILEEIKAANAAVLKAVKFGDSCRVVDGGAASEYHYVIDMPDTTQAEIDQAIEDVDAALQDLDISGRRLATLVASSGTDQDSVECAASSTSCGADTQSETSVSSSTTGAEDSANNSARASDAPVMSGIAAVALALGAAVWV